MSGEICRIIINGNQLQALAEAGCELAGTNYDGVEVMTDEQRETLAKLMERQVHEFRVFLKPFLGDGTP